MSSFWRSREHPSLAVLMVVGLALMSCSGPARAAAPCSAHANGRAARWLADAQGRALTEARGPVVIHDISLIAHDRRLLDPLRRGNLGAARTETRRIVYGHVLPGNIFISHIVRLQVTEGARHVIDANASNFAVAGPSARLRRSNGTVFATLRISIQDVRGYVKYMRDRFGTDLVIRGANGQLVTTLPAAARLSLPRSGCVAVAGHRWAVRSFGELSFDSEPLTIWILAR